MTDQPTIEAEVPKLRKRDRKKGPGAGRPPPAVVINGGNYDEYFPIPKPKIGAPSTFTHDMADRICYWLSQGKTLRSFCLQEGTPETTTVNDWRRAHPEFDIAYAQARDEGADRIAEMVVDESTISVPPEQVQAARLAFDARRWYASKIAPRRYADKLDVRQEISGPNGQPITLQVQALIGLIENPLVMERLSDVHVAAIREAAALLALPAPPVIDGEAVPVEASETEADD